MFITVYRWCGHCKEFLPKFEEASETIEAEGLNVKFLKVSLFAFFLLYILVCILNIQFTSEKLNKKQQQMDAETHKEVATT